MSDYTGVFAPKSFAIREPLDLKRQHGRITNPPRMNQLGGLDELKEPYGHFRNDMNLRKPGGTTSGSKK
jgi:hypothetical protein